MEKVLNKPKVTHQTGNAQSQNLTEDVELMDAPDIKFPESYHDYGDLEDYTEIYGDMDDLTEGSN